MHHVGARLGEQRRQLVLGLRVGFGDVDVAPQRALRQQPRPGRRVVPAGVEPGLVEPPSAP